MPVCGELPTLFSQKPDTHREVLAGRRRLPPIKIKILRVISTYRSAPAPPLESPNAPILPVKTLLPQASENHKKDEIPRVIPAGVRGLGICCPGKAKIPRASGANVRFPGGYF